MRRIGLALSLLTLAGLAHAEARLLDWADLHGWAEDEHAHALHVFTETCGDIVDGDWPAVCALAHGTADARSYFETFFRPVMIADDQDSLFTGYYEPEVAGSRVRTERFRFPLYRRPDEAFDGNPWLTRKEIETSGVLENRGLEIVWLEDPVEKFFLQVQGSGRIRLTDGRLVRVGYGGKNGHPYKSIGMELVRRGVFNEHQVSAGTIRRWVRSNPVSGLRLLWHNPSYVFFREVSEVPPDKGPLGAMNRPITERRTLAVDPDFVPLGAPV